MRTIKVKILVRMKMTMMISSLSTRMMMMVMRMTRMTRMPTFEDNKSDGGWRGV